MEVVREYEYASAIVCLCNLCAMLNWSSQSCGRATECEEVQLVCNLCGSSKAFGTSKKNGTSKDFCARSLEIREVEKSARVATLRLQ